jgi:DNA-directed RNA polymerase specialized sigma24 family protein
MKFAGRHARILNSVGMHPDTCQNAPEGRAWFTTTQWTVVLQAVDSGSPEAARALAELCGAYWYPIYAFVRRKGHAPHDAQDLTQEFFARLIEKNSVGSADRSKGRFRSFLLGALEHFLAKEWRDARRLKRGGGRALLSLDEESAEARYRLEPADPATPERLFERRWALTLLEHSLERLGHECAAEGKGRLFEAVKGLLAGERTPGGYPVLARELGMSEGALMTAVHRLRKRYGNLLRDEIARTVSGPDEIEAELRQLFAALAS